MIQTKQKSGFTLIEVLVATVVMVILVGMVVSITGSVLDVWSKSSGKLSANAEARIAMELITQDLETAVFRNNGQQWLRVDGPETVQGNYASQTVALKLFTPSLNRDRTDPATGLPIAGDICGVAYRLEYQGAYDDSNAPNVYALYRKIERADTTFHSLLGSESEGTASNQLELNNAKSATGSNVPANNARSEVWVDSEILDEANYLASNIVDFQVLIYEEDTSSTGTALVAVNWDENGSELEQGTYAFGGEVSGTRVGSGGLNDPQKRLLFADVILKVVSDEGLEILALPTLAGTGFSNEDDVIQEHGQTFTRRVYFPANPL